MIDLTGFGSFFQTYDQQKFHIGLSLHSFL